MISDDYFVVSGSGSNHRENHLEPLERLECVRLTGGHENHLAALQAMRLASDADFRLTFHHLHQRIERSCVFAQSLAFVEGEERHTAGGPLDDLAAHDRAVLVVDEFRGLGHLVAGWSFRFGWGFWFHTSSLSIGSLVGGRAGSQSDQSRNSIVVARESNTPEPSHCHGIIHFRVFPQHLGAILGRDRNSLRGNPLAITASLAVQGGAVTVAKTVQEILRDLPRIHPDRTCRHPNK